MVSGESKSDFGADRFLSRSILIFIFQLTVYSWMLLSLLKPINDPDFWWHLASGRYLVQHRTIPVTDVFSLTATHTAWINTYWLFDALLYALYSLTGLAGVIFMHAAAVILALGIQQLSLRKTQVDWMGSAAAVLLIFLGAVPHGHDWGKYANIVTLVLLSWLLFSLGRWKRFGWDKTIWMAPFLFMLWANLHRGVIFGLIIAGFYALGSSGIAMKEWARRSVWLGACALGTLVNPFGFRIYKMMWDDFSLSSQFIMGWDKSLWPGLEIFWICVGLLWAVIAVRFFIKRKYEWDEWGTAAFLTSIAARHNFGVPFFMIFAVPALVRTGSELLPLTKMRPLFPGGFQKALLGLGLCLFLVLCSRTQVSGGFDKSEIPSGAFDLIENNKLSGPFYNDYFFGGYWIWRFAGAPPVFIDGRYPAVQGYIPLLDEIFKAKFNQPAVWAQFLNRYAIQGALVKYLPGSPLPSLYEAFFPKDKWALVYWDDAGLLYLRRDVPAQASVIQEWEFKEVLPDATPAYFLEKFKNAGEPGRRRIAGELKKNLALHPDSQKTRQLLALIGAS